MSERIDANGPIGREIIRMRDERDALRVMLQEWHDLTRLWLDDPSASYEESAAEFFSDTRLMAPGKDDPFSGEVEDEERRVAWKKWNGEKVADRMARTKAALDQRTTG